MRKIFAIVTVVLVLGIIFIMSSCGNEIILTTEGTADSGKGSEKTAEAEGTKDEGSADVEKKCDSDEECDRGEYCGADGICREGCLKDGHCKRGEICVNKTCVAGCRSDKDCKTNEICINEKCVPAECTEDEDCGAGMLCIDKQCKKSCTADSQCGSGQICYEGSCIKGCRSDSDCQGGQVCYNLECYKRCNDDSECPSYMICRDSKCQQGCREDIDCTTGQICVQEKCQAGCRHDTDCRSGQLCENEKCVSAQCSSDADCKDSSKECQNGRCVDKPPAEVVPEPVKDGGVDTPPEVEPVPEVNCTNVGPDCTCRDGWLLSCGWSKTNWVGGFTNWGKNSSGVPAANCYGYNPKTWEQECTSTPKSQLHCQCSSNACVDVYWLHGDKTSTIDQNTADVMTHCQNPEMHNGSRNKIYYNIRKGDPPPNPTPP